LDQETPKPEQENQNGLNSITHIDGLFENWFIDYASYVILERAVPSIEDGLKPVQRRIFHAMNSIDDGRYNKVANIIGQTMQFHPHGDASIYEAIVNLGQKDLLIDTQGNWGDMRTGDGAAAARYIEARLSKFAIDVLFNPQTTEWQMSYDGRKKEPVHLPAKFPLLLAQGVEGIAVGLATKILPHNFIELCEASIDVLQNKPVSLVPDFPTGGLMDVSGYNQGLRGGKIRVRAKIEDLDKKVLVIKEIPFSTTTTSLMESIVKASDEGKIKIKKVVDNTAKDVEIQVQLAPGVSPDVTIDALYAFTQCQVSLSPNACIIVSEKPHFMGVNEILRICTEQTMALLKRELEIRRGELMEKILFSSLEKIFIENRIYRDIEECESWEAVIETIDKGLTPYKPNFYRKITRDDIVRLTEIKIKRISKYDGFKADELMKDLQAELEEVENNLQHLRQYTIRWYQGLLKKYGKGRERKTEIRTFDTIQAQAVVANNAKLYVNRAEGFIGYGLKKDEFVSDCSDMDDVIAFFKNGKMKVVKIEEKVFVGKDIIHVGVFRKNDERMVYNMCYLDPPTGNTYAKRFAVLGITRDKEYDLTKGAKGSKISYFSANPNGEAEVIFALYTPGTRARTNGLEFNFAELSIKGRESQGNILTKYPIKKISLRSAGVSTLGGIDIWFDETIGRLNTDGNGHKLGNFEGPDKILVFYKDGSYELTSFELTNRYEPDQIYNIQKFELEQIISAVHTEGDSGFTLVKRFKIENQTIDKRFLLISESKNSKLWLISTQKQPQVEIEFRKDKKSPIEKIVADLDVVVDVKGWRAMGNRLCNYPLLSATLLPERPAPEMENEQQEDGQMKLW
jgi:topoisomerase-4 subunit A